MLKVDVPQGWTIKHLEARRDKLHLVAKPSKYLYILAIYLHMSFLACMWFNWMYYITQIYLDHYLNLSYACFFYMGLIGIAELCKNDHYIQYKRVFSVIYSQIVDSSSVMLIALLTEHIFATLIWGDKFYLIDSVQYIDNF